MRTGQPKGEASTHLGSFFFCLLPHEPALCKLGWARKGMCLFHLRFLLWSVDFSFVPFSQAFPFLCLQLPPFWTPFPYSRASLVAQLVKNPPTMRETWVPSLCWEDPLEKAFPSTVVAWRIPWTIQSVGSQSRVAESDTTERLSPHTFCFNYLTVSSIEKKICSGLRFKMIICPFLDFLFCSPTSVIFS